MRLRTGVAVVVVFLLCALRFGSGIAAVRFHPDESQWIATSSALEAFVSADLHSDVWQERYWTLTHPPLARYVIGIGRRLGGYAPADLNRPWRWGEDFATNQRAGKVPSQRLLWYARLPMALLAALSGTIAFVLVAAVAGRLAAYCWVAVFLVSSYFDTTLCRAMSEAVLLCAVLIAMLAGWRTLVAAARVGGRSSARRAVAWLLGTACACGIAAAAKLTGAMMLVPLVALAASVVATLRRRVQLPLRWCALLFLLVAEIAVLPFVALNPYLYPAPLTRAVRMVEQRRSEMRWQAATFADDRMPDGWQRPARIWTRLVHDFAPARSDGAGALNALVSGLGLIVVIGIWRRAPAPEARCAAAVIVVAAAANGLPPLFSALDWERYYLLPEVFVSMLLAIGAAAAAGSVRAYCRWPAARGGELGLRPLPR
jgi:hypothetical protein